MVKTRTTLDQWITLQAVVDYGGFAQAAEILHQHNHQLVIPSVN
ncbi:LysR family transcriptional regulator [Providencia hangzhouensis]